MSFLLEHLPPSAHVVIATRADPPFPLARLRAQGQLVEIRAADLRFTREEAAAYLNQAAGLDLESSQVAALEERTEGWIAALQLAALSMQGRDDVDDFIAGFAGDDRFVVDYLVEEVLDRQADDVRRFLLWTCILDRLTGALCDAVTGEEGGQRHTRGTRSPEPFLDSARRSPRVVPIPPSVRGRPPGTPVARGARPRAGPSSARECLVRAARGAV